MIIAQAKQIQTRKVQILTGDIVSKAGTKITLIELQTATNASSL